jgi:uncharacterized coiled-coil protein SlyX
MIKFQNKKIQEFQNELEKRDHNIQTLITENEGYRSQMESFKRQVNTLEEKLKLYETDISYKADNLTSQLKFLADSEGKLRSQLIAKDKIIYELEMNLNDQDIVIKNLNKQVIEKDEVNKSQKQEINEILSKFRNISKRMESREDEFNKVANTKETTVQELTREKLCLEDKLNQVLDIIKQYSKELNELNNKIYHYEAEYKAAQLLNERQNEEIEQLINENNNLQKDLMKYKDLHNKVNEAEKLIDELENLLNNEKVKNDKLSKNNQELIDKYQLIKEKLNGENNPENLKNIINERLNEINRLNINIDNLSKNLKVYENKNQELEFESQNIFEIINNELISITQWVETYLGNFYDNNFNIPDINLTLHSSLRNKLKLEALKEIIFKTRRKINEDYNKLLSTNNELKMNYSDEKRKIADFDSQIFNLKKQISEKNEEIKNYQLELENYRISINSNKENFDQIKFEFNSENENLNKFLEKISACLKMEIEKVFQNENLRNIFQWNSKDTYGVKIYTEIENNFDKISQILNFFTRDYESLLYQNEEAKILKIEYERIKKEMNERIKQHTSEIILLKRNKDNFATILENEKNQKLKFLEENYLNEIESLKFNLNEKEDFLIQLQQENILMKAKFETKSENIKNLANNKLNETVIMKDKLKDSYKEMENKYKNLLTEMEFKDRQIKSQEQMINRRINNEKSFVVNNIDQEKLKAFEVFKFYF